MFFTNASIVIAWLAFGCGILLIFAAVIGNVYETQAGGPFIIMSDYYFPPDTLSRSGIQLTIVGTSLGMLAEVCQAFIVSKQ